MQLDSIVGSGNFIRAIDFYADTFSVTNDSAATLTVIVNNNIYTVEPNFRYGLSGISLFNSITIVSSGDWRCEVQGPRNVGYNVQSCTLSGTGNTSKTLDFRADTVHIANTGTTDVTIALGDKSFLMLPNEEFYRKGLDFFTSVSITAVGPWSFVIQGPLSTEAELGILVSDLLPGVRKRIRDEGKEEYMEDADLLIFINDAISYLNKVLITNENPVMIEEWLFTNNMYIPNGFEKTCGKYPLKFANGKIQLFVDSSAINVRYFCNRPHVTAVTDRISFPVRFAPAVTQVAAMFALNRITADITQDQSLLSLLN